MVFELQAVSARKGDALVLRWTKGRHTHTILIDGGPSGVWDADLRPHLLALAGKDAAGQQKRLELDLVVVSHVDDDHIAGVIDLANEIQTAQKTAETPVITMHHAPCLSQVVERQFVRRQYGDRQTTDGDLSSVAGEATTVFELGVARDADRSENCVGLVALRDALDDRGNGVREYRLPRYLRVSGLRVHGLLPLWNLKLVGLQARLLDACLQAVVLRNFRSARNVSEGVVPDTLREKQIKMEEAAKKGRGSDSNASDISALAAAFDDPSVTNQSSIALHVKRGNHTMLLAGDIRGDQLLDAVEHNTELQLPLHVDLFKIPHHGSAHSNSRELFETITADQYVISGNGEHGNPHPDVLSALFDTLGGREIAIHLTNHPPAGARKDKDKVKAAKAQEILDAAAEIPGVTIVYRDEKAHAITVPVG